MRGKIGRPELSSFYKGCLSETDPQAFIWGSELETSEALASAVGCNKFLILKMIKMAGIFLDLFC